MEDNTKNLFQVIINFIQVILLLVSGLWAYFRFRKESPLLPRLEFSLTCDFLGPQQESYLASFTITVGNKGNVEHRFKEIRLRILGINKSEPLTEFEKYPPMVAFPVEIMKGINIIPPEYGHFFVRPGVNQDFNFATKIPQSIRFIIVRATFKYELTNDLHSYQKIFEVKV